MWPDRVSNPGPLTYESGTLPTALRGPATVIVTVTCVKSGVFVYSPEGGCVSDSAKCLMSRRQFPRRLSVGLLLR